MQLWGLAVRYDHYSWRLKKVASKGELRFCTSKQCSCNNEFVFSDGYSSNSSMYYSFSCKNQSKTIPGQPWGFQEVEAPRISRQSAHEGDKVCQPYAPAAFTPILLVLISVRGWVDPKAIVRPEGLYVNEKFQWHFRESNQRPCGF